MSEVAYVNALVSVLKSKGGECELSVLGKLVPKPRGVVGSLGAVLRRNKDRFVVMDKKNRVKLSSSPSFKHAFQNPSLHDMFGLIAHVAAEFQARPPPATKDEFLSELRGAGATSEVLDQMSRRSYVKVVGGVNLEWNLAKILDAARRLPAEDTAVATAREGDSTSSIPELGERREQAESPDSRFEFVQSAHDLARVAATLCDGAGTHVAVDCEGIPNKSLSILTIAASDCVYIFDCVRLDPKDVCAALDQLFTSDDIKMFHDLHRDVVALNHFGNLSRAETLFDSQLAVEYGTGNPLASFDEMLAHFGCRTYSTKDRAKRSMQQEENYWTRRPLSREALRSVALGARSMFDARAPILKTLGDVAWCTVLEASRARADFALEHAGERSLCFDTSNDYAVASAELLELTGRLDKLAIEPLKFESEVADLLGLLPDDLKLKLVGGGRQSQLSNMVERLLSTPRRRRDEESIVSGEPTNEANWELSDVVLDYGRRPWCMLSRERVMLSDDPERMVTRRDLDAIIEKIGGFGHDNRAGLERKLHRISAIRDRMGEIVGLTMRVGRWFRGNAAMLSDLLLGSNKSILILGEPGSGKTTIVREATRLLSERLNVCVVDTSNEIAGDRPESSLALLLARVKFLTPSLDHRRRRRRRQHSARVHRAFIMIEAVQNHTPDAIVIDEIGRSREVEAARTVKQRGVRMMASAHGDLRKLIKNRELRGLVGGVETVTVGDMMAKEEAKKKGGEASKVKTQRAGEPTFDALIEVRRGAHNEWRVTHNVAAAVDAILNGQEYSFERRSRDPGTGCLRRILAHG
ncbi:hypothetical protein CTAYLR_001646 [Chrysophaeum taylorii]|uniref:AAA+ ATPase domain-containing protein n=1 Tax=Chrysophaeum taylorii TaxID=2483200 RepID=A0AAD7UBU9_9STRA|nr:hypothetical protein CTAYLR_001646 [Chrysophaeum taylorii]